MLRRAILKGVPMLVLAAGLVLAASQPARAFNPDRDAKNAINVELLGPGFWYSVNYERLIVFGLAARVGIGFLRIPASDDFFDAKVNLYSVPFGLNYLGISSGKHTLELGLGGTALSVDGSVEIADLIEIDGAATLVFGTTHYGYRLQPVDGGFQFRIGIMNMFGHDIGFPVWAYLSLGGAF